VKVVVAALTITIVVLAALSGTVGDFAGLGLVAHVALGVLAALALRIGLWLAYRPVAAPPSDAALPTLTVVVPAYNEGPGVERTLNSILASNYPPDRLRVIAVDDGSTDDTGPALDRARTRLGARLTVIHLPRNRGKRAALYEGFTRATSDVLATVDSDSIVEPDTLRHLVAPLVARPEVAGVAGRVVAWNRAKNLLTRMLHVRYVLGFDFVRAYQSQLGTVWCCPGALQAYRTRVVAPHLDAWRDQRFLGAPCTNGDDHAMTNLVLRLGYDTVYQATATVHTLVPERYGKLCKMYIRWARSATREGFRALRFTPRRALAKGPLRGAAIVVDALAQPVAIVSRCLSVLGGAWLAFASPLWLLRSLFVATLFALPYALVFLRSERSTDVCFGVLYGWFALFGLFWIQPFATFTVRRRGWMTRG
jgi:hyaluronan synthase